MFYTTHRTFEKLSCRTRNAVAMLRGRGDLPSETLPDGRILIDVDTKEAIELMRVTPNKAKPDRILEWGDAKSAFKTGRIKGTIACEKTGEIDHMAAMEADNEDLSIHATPEGATLLDIKKRVADVKYRETQTEKLEVALKALTGDLIERDTVETWVRRYLGNMHQQILDLAATGLATDLYNLVKCATDGNAAIKGIERDLEKALSGLIKDSTETMRRNQL